METLISKLLDLPAQVHRGDVVLNLAEGVTRPEATLRDYVVTPQRADGRVAGTERPCRPTSS